MKFLLALVFMLSLSFAFAGHGKFASRFSSFKSRFGKNYASRAEEIKRFEKFQEKVTEIDQHNEGFDKGEHTYTRDINQFSDMFEEEKKNHTGLIHKKKEKNRLRRTLAGPYTYDGLSKFYVYTASSTELANSPASLDWTTKGFTKAVDNQGYCGSCWAFAGGAAIDAAFKIQKNIVTSQSQEELVDCTYNLGNAGCDGGLIETPFRHITQKGITPVANYPYLTSAYSNGIAGTCQTSKMGSTTKLSSYVFVDGGEESVKAAIAKYGPCATSLDVEDGLMSYKSGVYNGKATSTSTTLECSADGINHAVVIVGYGVDPISGPYWKIRNSWGSAWGESGHFRISRGQGMCGIASEVWCGVA